MFIVADQIFAHCIGDYVVQSDYMASEKTKKSVAAFAHVFTYTLCFLPLTSAPLALAVIMGSHFIIDRWRLARYVVWAKNFLAPRWQLSSTLSTATEAVYVRNLPWEECKATGYTPNTPPFMSIWLMIIVDNLMHFACNAAALKYLS